VAEKKTDNVVVRTLADGGHLRKVGKGRFVKIDTYEVVTKRGVYKATVHIETEATQQPVKG